MSYSPQTHAREIADALGTRDSEVQLAELTAERARRRYIAHRDAARRGRPLAYVVIAALATVIALAIWGAL